MNSRIDETGTTEVLRVREESRLSGVLRTWSAELGLAGVIAISILLFSLLNPIFFSTDTLLTVLRAMASVGTIAVGMTLLLVSGKFDLSIGAVAALGAVVSAQFMTVGLPPVIAIVLGLVASALVGFANALLSLWASIPVLIVTLGTMYVARGLALVISNGRPISSLPRELIEFAQMNWLGLSFQVWAFIVVAVIAHLILTRTTAGRSMYASGGNPIAARLAGVRVRLIQTVLFVVVSVLSGATGVLIMARIEVAQPAIGAGYELTVVASCAVGGVSLFGGRGSVLGAVLGVLFIQIVSVGMVLAHVDPTLQQVGIGVALLAAITVDVVRRRTSSPH